MQLADAGNLGPDDKVSWSATRADGVVAMAREYLSDSQVSGQQSMSASSFTADNYQVVVHIDQTALSSESSGQNQLCQSELPVETVIRSRFGIVKAELNY